MSTANACVPRKPEATPSPGIYRRRRPERTVLYQAVQENIESYLSQTRWENPLGDAVPAYVEHDLRQYLTCGILAYAIVPNRSSPWNGWSGWQKTTTGWFTIYPNRCQTDARNWT
jgi:hypothetical protein